MFLKRTRDGRLLGLMAEDVVADPQGGGGGTSIAPVTEPPKDDKPQPDPSDNGELAKVQAELATEKEAHTAEREAHKKLQATNKGTHQEFERLRAMGLADTDIAKTLTDAGLTPEKIRESLRTWGQDVTAESTRTQAEAGKQPMTRGEFDQAMAEERTSRTKDSREAGAKTEYGNIAAALANVPDGQRDDYTSLVYTRLTAAGATDELGRIPASAGQIDAAVKAALERYPLAAGEPAPAAEPGKEGLAPTAAEAAIANAGPAGGPGGVQPVKTDRKEIDWDNPEEVEKYGLESMKRSKRAREAREAAQQGG